MLCFFVSQIKENIYLPFGDWIILADVLLLNSVYLVAKDKILFYGLVVLQGVYVAHYLY